MSARDHYGWTLRIGGITRQLEQIGMHVEVGTDFARYRRIRAPHADTRPIYPMFDIASTFVDASNGFWIIGTDAEGRLVHTQAFRLLPLGDMTLRQHLQVHHQKYVTPGMVDDPDATRFEAHRGLDEISGRVCYQGEFWLEGGLHGFRGGGAVALLSRLGLELAAQTWAPDFVFAFIGANHALNGTPLRHCYYNAAPGSWATGDGRRFSEEWLVWMSGADLVGLAREAFETSFAILEATPRGPRKPRLTFESRQPEAAPTAEFAAEVPAKVPERAAERSIA